MEALNPMAQGGAGAGAPTPGGAPPTGAQAPEAGPAGSPAASPMQPKGQQEVGKAKVQMAVKVLKEVIGSFQYDSEEWQAIDKALTALLKKFPAQQSESLGNAQLTKLMTQSGGQ